MTIPKYQGDTGDTSERNKSTNRTERSEKLESNNQIWPPVQGNAAGNHGLLQMKIGVSLQMFPSNSEEHGAKIASKLMETRHKVSLSLAGGLVFSWTKAGTVVFVWIPEYHIQSISN